MSLHVSETRAPASQGLTFLSALDFDSRILGVRGLFARQIPVIVSATIEAAGDDDDFDVFLPASPEFLLLELSLRCPWRIVQGNMQLLTVLLEYLLRCVTKCTSHRLGRSFGGMVITEAAGGAEVDDMEMSLLRYGDLLLSALGPNTPSTPYELLHPTSATPPSDTPYDGPALALPLKGALCDAFVLNNHWASSSKLQSRRLDTLALLLHDMTQDTMKEIFGDKFIVLFQKVFSCSSAASTPLDIRMRSASLAKCVVELCVDEHIRVVSYDKRKNDSESWPSDSPLCDMNNLTAVLHLLMNITLDDSSDDVRVMTLETLMYVVPFIQRGREGTGDGVSAPHTFEGVVDRLLHRAIDGSPTERFLGYLDTVLRSVAVLSPAEFEVLLRGKFRLLTGVHKAPSAASELFSGLVDHCEMMMQFNSRPV